MRASEIAKELASQVEGVVRLLLPNGKREGHEWRAGSVGGEAGKSLGVHLTGEKAGVWADFTTSDSGDLIGLWMAVKGLALRDACTEAMAYLGIREDRIDPPRRQFSKPTRAGVHGLQPEHRTWLESERKIPAETITEYKIASRDGAIMFPFLRDGELVAAKYRKLPKSFRQDAECEPCLFGWQAIPADARSVVITEGELDAMAWHAYGFPALSVPMGGGAGAKQGWVQGEFERLALFDVIFLSMDSDGPGQQAERDLVERLGRERCRVIRLPHKDANECLMREVPRAEMEAAIREARSLDPSELRDVSEFEDAIWAEYNRVDEGLRLPWEKTWSSLLLRPGETSIWAGVNGHGKSAVIAHVVGDLAAKGYRCCVASMEYRPALWMMRMNRLISGVAKPTEQFSRHITRSLKGKLLAFDVTGKAKAARILEVFRYARRRYQIELFVIDNLTKCGFDDDDYSGQKQFVEELTDFARAEQTHVGIVAHMKKSQTEDQTCGKWGVKGSGGITDMADTVIEIWRNKPRERAFKEARLSGADVPKKFADEADTLLLCLKQRATGEEPVISLWFEKGSTQFVARSDHRARPLVEFAAVSIGERSA